MVLQHCIACFGVAMAMSKQPSPYAATATVNDDDRTHLARCIMGGWSLRMCIAPRVRRAAFPLFADYSTRCQLAIVNASRPEQSEDPPAVVQVNTRSLPPFIVPWKQRFDFYNS